MVLLRTPAIRAGLRALLGDMGGLPLLLGIGSKDPLIPDPYPWYSYTHSNNLGKNGYGCSINGTQRRMPLKRIVGADWVAAHLSMEDSCAHCTRLTIIARG